MANKHIAFSRAKRLVIPYIFDGGGSPISGNPFGFLPVSFAGYIESATLLGDAAPTLVDIDIQMCDRASYPGGLVSIVGSAPPTLAGVEQMEDDILPGWTRDFVKDSVFKFIVLDTDTVTVITIALNVIRF